MTSAWQGPLWAWAPFELVQRIYRDARRAMPWPGGSTADPGARQAWLRRVQREFDRRLREARIYVEGMS